MWLTLLGSPGAYRISGAGAGAVSEEDRGRGQDSASFWIICSPCPHGDHMVSRGAGEGVSLGWHPHCPQRSPAGEQPLTGSPPSPSLTVLPGIPSQGNCCSQVLGSGLLGEPRLARVWKEPEQRGESSAWGAGRAHARLRGGGGLEGRMSEEKGHCAEDGGEKGVSGEFLGLAWYLGCLG